MFAGVGRPAHTTRSLFVPELDGTTYPTRADAEEAAYEEREAAEVAWAEGAWLRSAEYNPSVLEEEYLNPFLNDPAVGLVARGF